MYSNKSRYRHVKNLAKSTLVALFASVLLFGGTANAQPVEQTEKVRLDLFTAGPMVELENKSVLDKLTEFEQEQKEKEELEELKNSLDSEVKSLEQQIAELKQKIADKKAREAARQAELKRQRAATQSTQTTRSTHTSRTTRSYNTSGNTYTYGYCTWYVKNMAPWIPNLLGNANTWYYRAQSMGLSTGTTPRAGAVGTTERGAMGHVVYVRSVNGDGTINISDMNYGGWNVVTHRTVDASQFRYIYP